MPLDEIKNESEFHKISGGSHPLKMAPVNTGVRPKPGDEGFEEWQQKVRDHVEKFNQMMHPQVCGSCRFCGGKSGVAGNACLKCQELAGLR